MGRTLTSLIFGLSLLVASVSTPTETSQKSAPRPMRTRNARSNSRISTVRRNAVVGPSPGQRPATPFRGELRIRMPGRTQRISRGSRSRPGRFARGSRSLRGNRQLRPLRRNIPKSPRSRRASSLRTVRRGTRAVAAELRTDGEYNSPTVRTGTEKKIKTPPHECSTCSKQDDCWTTGSSLVCHTDKCVLSGEGKAKSIAKCFPNLVECSICTEEEECGSGVCIFSRCVDGKDTESSLLRCGIETGDFGMWEDFGDDYNFF